MAKLVGPTRETRKDFLGHGTMIRCDESAEERTFDSDVWRFFCRSHEEHCRRTVVGREKKKTVADDPSTAIDVTPFERHRRLSEMST